MIPYERCQEPSCPLTRGWENLNHSVQPGCNRHGKFIQCTKNISAISTESIVHTRMAQFNTSESKITNMTCVEQASEETNSFLDNSQVEEEYAPCCNCHGKKEKQLVLRCVLARILNGMKCSSCFPMKYGQCSNSSPVPISTLQKSSS